MRQSHIFAIVFALVTSTSYAAVGLPTTSISLLSNESGSTRSTIIGLKPDVEQIKARRYDEAIILDIGNVGNDRLVPTYDEYAFALDAVHLERLILNERQLVESLNETHKENKRSTVKVAGVTVAVVVIVPIIFALAFLMTCGFQGGCV